MKLLIVALLSALIVSTPAHAKRVRVDMSGHLYHVTPSVSGAFQIGNTVTASFTFDASDLGEPWYPGGNLDPAFRYFPNAPISGGLGVNGYELIFSPGSRMFVSNNEVTPSGPIDRVLFDDHFAAGSPIAGMNFRGVFFNFQDWSATAIDQLALPNSQEAFDRFSSRTGAIDWLTNDAQNRITFSFETVAVTALPEPGVWVALIMGFGVVGGALRSRRRATATSSPS